MAIDTSQEAVEQINEELSWDNSFGAIELINALLAERDAALAEVARLSTPPDDAEVVLLADRATELDPVLEVDFDTQLDVERNPYGAHEAIETALHLIRDQADAITRLSHALAAERKLSDEGKRLLEMAQDRCGHNFIGAEYPAFVDFCDALEARRKE